jgi:hypothetical protein
LAGFERLRQIIEGNYGAGEGLFIEFKKMLILPQLSTIPCSKSVFRESGKEGESGKMVKLGLG